MRETTTIGSRWRVENRIKAHHTVKKIDTQYSLIHFKAAEIRNQTINISHEFEVCKRVALEKGIPLKKVIEEVKSRGLG